MIEERVVTTADREITETRIVNASRELLWKVWTEPAHITQWWGPNGFTNTTEKMDVRPGGEWPHVMHGPDGRNYPNRIVYREVVKPERLVYDHISTPHHRTTVTFEDIGGGKTKLTMTMIFDTTEEKRWTVETFQAEVGLKQTLGRLEEYLPGVN
jgi:uncharacterized protein YndB with AHSA1/START domain